MGESYLDGLSGVYRVQFHIVNSPSRPHRASKGVCVLIKILSGQTRDSQYTQKIRNVSLRFTTSSLRKREDEVQREHEFIYCLIVWQPDD